WGPSGSALYRMNSFGAQTFEGHNPIISGVTSAGVNLHIGSSGTPNVTGKWGGGLLELSVYDRQLGGSDLAIGGRHAARPRGAKFDDYHWPPPQASVRLRIRRRRRRIRSRKEV